MAAIESNVLNGHYLNRYTSSINKIKEQIEAWQTNSKNINGKINWQFTNKDAMVN